MLLFLVIRNPRLQHFPTDRENGNRMLLLHWISVKVLTFSLDTHSVPWGRKHHLLLNSKFYQPQILYRASWGRILDWIGLVHQETGDKKTFELRILYIKNDLYKKCSLFKQLPCIKIFSQSFFSFFC